MNECPKKHVMVRSPRYKYTKAMILPEFYNTLPWLPWLSTTEARQPSNLISLPNIFHILSE